jgi:ABC-type spermidine/putrescine transport system permease subunit II
VTTHRIGTPCWARIAAAVVILGGLLVINGIAALLAGSPSLGQICYVVGGACAVLLGMRMVPVPTLLGAFSGLIYLVLYAPIVVVVIYAFNAGKDVAVWDGLSTQWFSAALADDNIRSAVGRSFLIAIASALLATAIATPAALALCRAKSRIRSAGETIVLLTIAVPELVIGASVLIFFANAGISLGTTSMVVGHSIFNIGFVLLLVRARFLDMNDELEESAQDLGAGPFATFVQVTLPAIAPAVLAGFLLAFTFSFDNVVVSSFTSGAGNTTWPLYVFSSLRFGLTPELNATASLMMLVTFISLGAVALIQRAGSRRHAM